MIEHKSATFVTCRSLQEVARDTDGCTAADLHALAQRAQHAAAARLLTSRSVSRTAITAADWQAAREGFVPSAYWGVKAAGQGGPTGWQDVGGLAQVRQALMESLEIPTRYGVRAL